MGFFQKLKEAVQEADEKREREEERRKRLEGTGVNCSISYKKTFDSFIAFDVETTGLDGRKDRIVELSALKFEDGKVVDSFSTLINPGRPIPAEVSKINHIRDKDVQYAPSEKKAMDKFSFWLGEAKEGEIALVAHNASFDISFLESAFVRSGVDATIKYKDTLSMARRKLPDLENHKLGTVAEHFGIEMKNAHRAESDAEVCGKIFIELLKE